MKTDFVCPRFLLLWLFVLAPLTACGGDALAPVVYLGWDAGDRVQIFVQEHGREPRQLSQAPADVFDFAVAPGGKQIAFSVLEGEQSSIWLVDGSGRNQRQVLGCDAAECTHLVWAPDGERLIYELRPVDARGVSSTPTLHWLDAQTGESRPLFADETAFGTAVRFAPDGSAISYVIPDEEVVRVYNFATGETFTVPDEIGSPAVWSPQGDWLAYSNLDVVVLHGAEGDDHATHTHDFVVSTRMFLADTRTGQYSQVSPSMSVDDGNAAWSPSGEWLAFGRKQPRGNTGRQLWLMRRDGTASRALTDDLLVQHGPPAWSEDGRYLLFQRFDMRDVSGEPAVWLVDVETGDMRELVVQGMQPAWLE